MAFLVLYIELDPVTHRYYQPNDNLSNVGLNY